MLSLINSHHCQVTGCNSNSNDVVMYSARRSRDSEKYLRWMNILNKTISKSCIYACQRHFPAGAPTKNNPDPNPDLFNPILNTPPAPELKVQQIFSPECTPLRLGLDGNCLPPPVLPPPGSIFKLAPNTTLIDLKKLKEQEFNKLFRIEEVTVMIDEKDSVKVVDYGPKEGFTSSSDMNGCKYHKSRKSFISNLPVPIDHEASIQSFVSNMDESTFEQFYDTSPGNALENMRQLHIDCDTVIVDITKRYAVYAHKTILISKSPFFFKQLFLKRRKGRKLYHFCCLDLPTEIDYSIVDAVVSYIYTGSLHYLLENDAKEIKKLLVLLEMKQSLELYEHELNGEIGLTDKSSRTIKQESGIKESSESVLILPSIDGNDDKMSVIEIGGERNGKKKRKLDVQVRSEVTLSKEDYFGKLKVSVQKIVENALNPFLGKIEELFDPSGTTLNIAKTSQHIITLWHADILLTKLFDQSELTKFFSEVMNELLEKNSNLLHNKNIVESKYPKEGGHLLSGSYTVESLNTQTGDSQIDQSYLKPSLDEPIPVETQTDGDTTQVINYQTMLPKHISKYVHLIAMYRFNIFMKKRDLKTSDSMSSKDALMPSLLEGDTLNDDAATSVVMEDLVNNIEQGEDLLNNFGLSLLTKSCFEQVTVDLKRRVVADLELYINPSFHEELIMHIIVDQMDEKNVLPLTMGVFLAKGCNFCRKKECKVEDLSMPISSSNPVCPDRECIKQNLHCYICNKQMSTSRALSRHKYGVHDVQTSVTSGLFICSHCGETFSKKWKLNMHERDHEDRKMELFCRYCKKKIRGSVALKKHISTVHEAKPQYNCEYCPKAFKRRETLNVHRRIHTREKPFGCDFCVYASETKGNLKAHILRKHKHLISDSESQQGQIIGDQDNIIAEENNVIPEQDVDHPLPDDQVMAATIVAHSLSDGSFIITSESSPSSLVP